MFPSKSDDSSKTLGGAMKRVRLGFVCVLAITTYWTFALFTTILDCSNSISPYAAMQRQPFWLAQFLLGIVLGWIVGKGLGCRPSKHILYPGIGNPPLSICLIDILIIICLYLSIDGYRGLQNPGILTQILPFTLSIVTGYTWGTLVCYFELLRSK